MHREEDYCDYQTSMLLKKKGYNEPCETSYGTAVMHNGEDIDEDEENKCVNCIAEFVHGKSIIDGTDTYEQICSEAILFCLKKKKLLNK